MIRNDISIPVEKYYPALDGLRGLAICMIILHHNFDFLAFTRPAWISLDLFFVLSGFLITGILLRKRSSHRFLRDFYARRVLRIFPIYYLSIVLLLFVLPKLIDYGFSMNYFLSNQYWFWLEIQNWLFILKPDGNNNFLNHYWSLGLEEQFYLVSPWIILLIKPVQKIISFLLFLLLTVFVIRLAVWSFHFKNISYINLYAFTRIDGLCIGSLLAIFQYQGSFELKRVNRLLGILFLTLIFIVLPFIKLIYHTRLPLTACCLFPAIALFWVLIVWLSIKRGTVAYRIFSNRILIFFGRISYGLYIFHWPVNRLFRAITDSGVAHWSKPMTNFYVAIASTGVAIVIAVVSYYTYEKYFLGLKRYFTE
jgi:peptidoglycan/LPS O-acetylase OafA/YrhL